MRSVSIVSSSPRWALALALWLGACSPVKLGYHPGFGPPVAQEQAPLGPPEGLGVPAHSSAARPREAPCRQGEDPFLVVLERLVAPSGSVRILAVAEEPMGAVVLRQAASSAAELRRWPLQGPPDARIFHLRAPARPGSYPLRLKNVAGDELACLELAVRDPATARPRPAPPTGIWQSRRPWTPAWERVYSAWIAHLFRPLPKRQKAWKPLHWVLRHPQRNFLHNRLGHREDDSHTRFPITAWADCADTPYQLRAYFAWKFELPYRFRRCDRGDGLRGPSCPFARDNRLPLFDQHPNPVQRFNAFLMQGVAWSVHSGSMRTLPEDEGSDFYPIALHPRAIRPGTVFVDAGGHALVVTRWDSSGLHVIDGHPDLSVTRRRFDTKSFPYYRGLRTGGFKAFRPIRLQAGRLVPLPNAEAPGFSVAQYRFKRSRAFFELMQGLILERAGQALAPSLMSPPGSAGPGG